MIQEMILTYKEIREIAKINESVNNYLRETYPEAFLYWCDVCNNKYPCSSQNWGIKCKEEKKW